MKVILESASDVIYKLHFWKEFKMLSHEFHQNCVRIYMLYWHCIKTNHRFNCARRTFRLQKTTNSTDVNGMIQIEAYIICILLWVFIVTIIWGVFWDLKKKCICFDTVNNGLINNTYKLPEYRLKEVRWQVSLQASKKYAF